MIVAQLRQSLKEEWPHDTTPALVAFYGNPTGFDGGPSQLWEHNNIRRLHPPYQMYRGGDPVVTIRFTTSAIASLERVLRGIKKNYSPREIERFELNACGDAYSFKRARGSLRLSTHAYGCAFDFATAAATFFEDEGWSWGGSNNPAHFQATVE